MNKEDTFTAIMGDFRSGSLGFFNRGRSLGYQPSLGESSRSPFALPLKETPKKPFDDTVLNQNDFIIKKRRRNSFDESMISNESDFEGASVGTPWETQHLRTELSQARAEIKTLEANISQLHGVRRESEVLFENEKSSLKASLERERTTVKGLERRVKTLKRREQNLKEELANVISSRENANRENLSELQDENATLRDKLAELEKEKSEADLSMKTMKVELEKTENNLKIATEQLEAVNDQLEKARKTVKEFEVNKAALTNAHHKIKQLEGELISNQENAEVVKIQQSKLMKYGELERQLKGLITQNNKLRESTTNSFYLESVVEELRAKLKMMDERERQLSQCKSQIGVLEIHLESFKSLSKEVAGVGSSAENLSAYIRRLQAEDLVQSNQINQLKSRIKNLEESGQNSNGQIDNLNKEIASLRAELETAQSNLKRLKKLNSFITMERNDLRSLIDSCQKEVTITAMSDPRIEVLEKLVESYRAKFQKLESNPNLLPDGSDSKDKAELEKLRSENQSLKEKIEQFEYELAHRAIKGDFNTMTTKILHCKNNPVAEAIAKQESEVETLRKENVQLKERLRLIKDGEADITENVAQMIGTDHSKELQEAKEKCRSQELQNQRLKEVFKKSLQEFREAIFALFGYKVDGLPNKVFRLTSLYAESQEHHLIFKLSNSGEMEMLENDFSKMLSELIEMILIQHNSIPLFLSSLTIDLFKRQTNVVLDSTIQQIQ